jgi:hypothetical protein
VRTIFTHCTLYIALFMVLHMWASNLWCGLKWILI